MEQFDTVVVGGGAAGVMAALRAVLNCQKTLLFLGDLDSKRRSRAQWVSEVDNLPRYPGIGHPITQDTQETINWIAQQETLKDRLTVVKHAVHTIEGQEGAFKVTWTPKTRKNPDAAPESAETRYVVLATGIMDVQPVIEGSIEPIFPFANANQVLYCIRCDGHRILGHATGIIGHSTDAAWNAIILSERYHPPSMTVFSHGRPLELTDELRTLFKLYNIQVVPGEIQRFEGVARKGGLQGLWVGDQLYPLTRAFVAMGVLIYHDLAVSLGASLDARGYVVTRPSGETTVPGLYAVGDLQAGKKKQIYTAWDTAVDAVDDIDRRLRKMRREALLAATPQE